MNKPAIIAWALFGFGALSISAAAGANIGLDGFFGILGIFAMSAAAFVAIFHSDGF